MSRYLLIILLLGMALPLSARRAPVQDALERGLEAEENGNYEEALSIWLDAKVELERPSLRLGRNYIRVATEQEMDRYYQAASAMYLWGLTGEDITFQKEYALQEVAYLEPMLSDDERERWNRLLEENNPALLREMQVWWENRDPTPATPYNERLIEHWQRIAYAREHYTLSDESVYGTDDRGVVYVKYGDPERDFDGILTLNPGSINSKVIEMLSAWNPGVATIPESWRSVARAMENAVLDLVGSPRYEVWIYERRYLDTNQNMVRIFGEDGSGEFRQLQTIDEMIPARAFTMGSRYGYSGLSGTTDLDINPAMVAQLLLYEKVASMDPIFASVYSRINFDLFKVGSQPGKQYPRVAEMRTSHDAKQRVNQEPEETSTMVKELSEIPVEIHQYRMLNEQNRPIFATFMESRPQPAFLEDFSVNDDTMMAASDAAQEQERLQEAFSAYRLVHGMELRNELGQRLTGSQLQPILILSGDNIQVASSSVFTVPYVQREGISQVYYAELHNRHPASEPIVETPLADHIRGLGRLRVEQPEPLDPDPSQLQMSDLIFGYQKTDSASAESFVPFVVSNDRQVPEGEQLAVHFEVYHLQEGENGLRDFTVDYEILPVNFLGWTRERKDDLSLTLFFEHDRARFSEDLEIQASDLQPGRYVMRLTATDRVSGQELRREVEFEVTETEEDE